MVGWRRGRLPKVLSLMLGEVSRFHPMGARTGRSSWSEIFMKKHGHQKSHLQGGGNCNRHYRDVNLGQRLRGGVVPSSHFMLASG